MVVKNNRQTGYLHQSIEVQNMAKNLITSIPCTVSLHFYI